jgi:hypothetical protein
MDMDIIGVDKGKEPEPEPGISASYVALLQAHLINPSTYIT